MSIEKDAFNILPIDSKKISNLIGFVKYFTTPNCDSVATFSRSMIGPLIMVGISLAFGSLCLLSKNSNKSPMLSVTSMMTRSGSIVMSFVNPSRWPFAVSTDTFSAVNFSLRNSRNIGDASIKRTCFIIYIVLYKLYNFNYSVELHVYMLQRRILAR